MPSSSSTMANSSNSRIPASSASKNTARYATGGISSSRSASTASSSTLPSIRSLRKAFQFTKHHSLDGQNDALRRSSSASNSPSITSTRTFSSGTLAIPSSVAAATPKTANGNDKNAIPSRSSSAPDIIEEASNVLSGSGTDNNSSNGSTSPSNINEDALKNVNLTHNKRSSSNGEVGRPLSTQSIPASTRSSSAVYSSSIPVNSRPTSISSSTIRSISSRADLKSAPSSPPVHSSSSAAAPASPPLPSAYQGSSVTPPLKTEDSRIEEREEEEEDEADMSIMHIRHANFQSSSTPPPVIPLPPIPNEHAATSASVYTLRSTKNSVKIPQNGSRYSLDVPRAKTSLPTSTSASSSLLDEPAPEALGQADDLSISSPPPPPIPVRRSPIPSASLNSTIQTPSGDQSRPGITRSRSAIESIKAMAEEVDILNNKNNTASSCSSSSLPLHAIDTNTRTRQTSLPKPVIMESPSRSPAVMDANKIFNFPISSSSSRGGEGGVGGLNVSLPALSAEIIDEGTYSSSTSALGSRSTSNQESSDGDGGLTIDSGNANTSGDLLNNSSYLKGLRRSATSPLSELVQRLNEHSPVKSGSTSPIIHEMDTSDLRSEEDPSEEVTGYRDADRERFLVNGDEDSRQADSPFMPQNMMEDEEVSNIEDGSVDESSGISVAPPSRRISGVTNEERRSLQPLREPRRSFERVSGRRVSADDVGSSSAASAGASAREVDARTLRQFENKISPQTEKRWSMAEVEAAYGRIRKLATRRSSAAVSEAPSFLISEDSKDMAPSYVQHLIDRGFPLDASIISSGGSRAASAPASEVGSRFATFDGRLSPRRDVPPSDDRSLEEGDEAGDALTPLVGRERYSPSTSPRVSPRALSPQTFAPFPNRSPRNSYIEASRTDSPYSSETGTGSSGNSRVKSNASPALTAPTTARHSQESEGKVLYAPTTTAPPILRSLSDQSEQRAFHSHTAKNTNGWRRRASAEASSAASSGPGSDDTGWVTPKTSAGDVMGRRRSVSPALTATRRGSSAMDHYDETPHHTTTAAAARRASSVRQRRPVSYSSSAGTDSFSGGQTGRNGSFRYTHGPSHSASHSSLWFDDTPKAASKARPGIPSDFRSSMAAPPHRREASSYSTTGSTYSLDSLGTSSFAEAKRADKIDLFLRCTKAESALQAITAHSQIEREALLDALQESRAMVEALRQQNEDLISELEHLRRHGMRKPAAESQEAARRVAEIVEARDEWQARAQTMERDLAATKQAQAKSAADSEAALASMRQEINRLQEQLTASIKVPKSPARNLPRATSLPRKSSPGNNSNNPLKMSMSPSGLPRSTGAAKSSLPRSRHSSGSNSIGFSPHGRTISNASSTFQTDFGDHLPASSDGWSLGDSQDASLRLDDSTARFLQDIDGQSVRSRQKSTTSSN
ncbi:hypothetical protein P389DRAFT_210221 [Cystobasidium minutum MCA 4210]|uniref:uncharacterized protein n=1 Tax=Cystobasidium minutum MCA 4210 TaxID=1397322 RepID=UPI0034CED59C|eukprot:jgi/Rhomi1/210221/estExt_Genemark1.C_3_t20452